MSVCAQTIRNSCTPFALIANMCLSLARLRNGRNKAEHGYSRWHALSIKTTAIFANNGFERQTSPTNNAIFIQIETPLWSQCWGCVCNCGCIVFIIPLADGRWLLPESGQKSECSWVQSHSEMGEKPFAFCVKLKGGLNFRQFIGIWYISRLTLKHVMGHQLLLWQRP